MAEETAQTASEPRKTRRSPRGDARRREIIDTAVRMFAEGGYNSVSLAHIAEKVGISQPGLLHHFPTKSDLLMAAIQERDENFPREGNMLVNLLSILRANEETPILVQLNAVISAEALVEGHPAHAWIRQVYALRLRAYIVGLEDLIDEAKLPAGITMDGLARLVIAANEGVRWEWVLEGQNFHRSDRMGMLLELLRPYYRDPEMILTAELPSPRASRE